jgi:RNA polymerase sigma-70 factor (ECF subfamily)
VPAPSPCNPVADLYVHHHGWLLGWLRGKLGCSHQAADVAQDTFIRVLTARVEAEIREPRAYLATVANRLVANFYRRQAIERAYLEALALLPEAEVPSPEMQLLCQEALVEIDRLLEGLGPKVKQVFILAQCEELPYAEIAARLQISLRSVNNYMARAMAHCCLMLP